MKISSYLKGALALSLAGTAFAGYLSGVKLFSGTCAFNEPCPYFLGYPACWYGLAMYLVMLGAAAAALLGWIPAIKAIRTNTAVSAVGIVFAGYFVLIEVMNWLAAGPQRYGLILPTCAYGLVFYIIICALSIAAWRGASGSVSAAGNSDRPS